MKLRDITCISDLYYVVGRWFTVGMLLISMATLPIALDKADDVFAFLMCGGIGFVGVAAEYRVGLEGKVHYVSAMTSAVCSLLFVAVVEPWCILSLLMALIGVIDRKRWLLWCEVACFVAAYTAIVV